MTQEPDVMILFLVPPFPELLHRLPEIFKPIVICAHWRDVQDDKHIDYAASGFEVVSAGHIFDPLFQLRFHYQHYALQEH